MADSLYWDVEKEDWYLWIDDTPEGRIYLNIGDWSGCYSVSVQKIGDGGADGWTFDDIHDAYSAYEREFEDLESDPWGYKIELALTWPDDDNGECWGSRPIMSRDTSTGAETIH